MTDFAAGVITASCFFLVMANAAMGYCLYVLFKKHKALADDMTTLDEVVCRLCEYAGLSDKGEKEEAVRPIGQIRK